MATFDFGNRSVTASITGSSRWEKDGMIREYFTLSFEGAKLPPIDKLYEVIAGSTSDETFTVGGKTYAFRAGLSADSKTKRRTVADACRELVSA